MSYVEIFAVQKNGDVESFGEAGNNHGYGPLVWQFLMGKYGFKTMDLFLIDPGLEKLWAALGTGKLTRAHDILLGSTMDHVWIRADILPELIEAQLAFNKEYIVPNNKVRTVAESAAIIQKMVREIPDLRGVAFNQCSAGSAFWYVQIPIPWDEWIEENKKALEKGDSTWAVGCECDRDGPGCFCDPESRAYNIGTDGKQVRGEYVGKEAWELMANLEESWKEHAA